MKMEQYKISFEDKNKATGSMIIEASNRWNAVSMYKYMLMKVNICKTFDPKMDLSSAKITNVKLLEEKSYEIFSNGFSGA